MIVITTPTGSIGRQVLLTLLASEAPLRVIARDPDRLPPAAKGRVDVVQGSHADAEVVQRAFQGAEAVFWLIPPNPRAESLQAAYVDFTRPACEAIRTHGVKRVVSVSALGRGTPLAAHAGLVTAALAMDDLIASTGVNFRALTMPSFMENMLRQVESIRAQGVFRGTHDGDRKMPTCATRDIAAVAARYLLDPTWTGQAEAPVLGPEDLSAHDMAAILTEVLGKPVRYQQMPVEALAGRATGNGMSEAYVRGYVEMMVAKGAGLDNAAPRTPEATTPTSFRQWSEEVLKPAVAG